MVSHINRRTTIINKICDTIIEVRRQGKEIIPKEFIILISEEHGCCMRTAKEYLSIGLLRCS